MIATQRGSMHTHEAWPDGDGRARGRRDAHPATRWAQRKQGAHCVHRAAPMTSGLLLVSYFQGTRPGNPSCSSAQVLRCLPSGVVTPGRVTMVHDHARRDSSPTGLRTADLLGALSLAADLAVGLPVEHAMRACYIGMHIARQLQVPLDRQADLYYAALLMDAGCTAWTSHLAAVIMGDEINARRAFVFQSDARHPLDALAWLQGYMAVGMPAHVRVKKILDFALHGRAFVQEGFQNSCAVAQRFAQRLGMSLEVQTTLLAVFEQWDGSGPNGMRATAIPLTARIVYATSFFEVFHRIGGRAAAVRLARQRRETALDPAVVDAFLSVAGDRAFWEGLEQESVWPLLRSMEPPSPLEYLPVEKLDDVALSFADFADLKSFYATGHSRRVSAVAERMARRMCLPLEVVTTVRRAALVHDLGLVAVPTFILDKPHETLTPVEWERLRLHPYHAERILAHVPGLEPVAPLVAAHHERWDGQGYYRGLSGEQIPLGARIIAVADRFDELTHDWPDHPALDVAAALTRIRRDVGKDFGSNAVEALVQETCTVGPPPPTTGRNHGREWPAGLTDREVEIVRLLSKGLSRRQMAAQLFLSEHTVRHHLEHIYSKIGVSTRVAATLFALEHDLLR